MAKKVLRETRPDEIRQIEQEPVDNLLLDSSNPRFATGLTDQSQEELLRVLWDDFAVDEIALSIAANGFFQEEPLFVVPENVYKKDGPFIVVEGNRRLAAVMLLRDSSLRQKIKATNLPAVTESARMKLGILPVSKYNNKRELWQFLGFRHINGPQPWDSFSKAVYVASVYDEHGIGLNEIANSIGDKHSTVKRLYRGYKILQQAEAMTSFKRDDRFTTRFAFSHLYTAVDQPDFQRFLGIDAERSLRPNPIPKSKLDDLRDLMIWFYGSKAEKRPPLIQSQNPDLNTLREIISEPRGVTALKAGLSLQRSHEISIGDERRFRNALVRAKEELQIADGTIVTGYSGEE
ncbi:MAG: ParB N-terminal domain-containing protein, partial [Nitrososphaera sp.]|nr:ParB N-terminal domain-containing protein [Nitrososphaera sp.]